MTAHTRRLLILRHAKADWESISGQDFDRPLAARGEQDAADTGRLIASLGPSPQVVLCSGALRTRSTWQHLHPHLADTNTERSSNDPTPTVEYSDELYSSSVTTWLRFLAKQDAATTSLLLIGHNPEMQSLLLYLAGEQVTAGDNGKIMPTATLCVLDIPSQWDQLSEDSAALIAIYRPRELIGHDR